MVETVKRTGKTGSQGDLLRVEEPSPSGAEDPNSGSLNTELVTGMPG